MSQKFVLQSWTSLKDDEIIRSSDMVEDFASGKMLPIGTSGYYSFLVGQRACQARSMPSVYDIVRTA